MFKHIHREMNIKKTIVIIHFEIFYIMRLIYLNIINKDIHTQKGLLQ